MCDVDDCEDVARILFHPYMFADGKLTRSAFPMDELLAKRGKNGVSVDRVSLLGDPQFDLAQKARENANPSADRSPYGFCTENVGQIRAITTVDEELQALDIFPDKIETQDDSKPWGQAHALMRKFGQNYTKSYLRGVRAKIMKMFSEHVVLFQNGEGMKNGSGHASAPDSERGDGAHEG